MSAFSAVLLSRAITFGNVGFLGPLSNKGLRYKGLPLYRRQNYSTAVARCQ